MSGHRTKVEANRFRVICLECPWFKVRLGASESALRELGGSHRFATKSGAPPP